MYAITEIEQDTTVLDVDNFFMRYGVILTRRRHVDFMTMTTTRCC